jgi:hypothetical protein
MERTNVTATGLVNIGLVSGLEYANLEFVRRFVRAIDKMRFSLVLTADVIACNVAEREALGIGIRTKWAKWQGRPWRIIPFCPHLVLLYDGGNRTPLGDIAGFAVRNFPQTRIFLFGPDGPIANGIDFLLNTHATVQTERRGYGGDYNTGSGGPDQPAGGTRATLRDSGARGGPRRIPDPALV